MDPHLATLTDHPSIPEILEFQINGIFVVFIVLSAIWLLVALQGQVLRLCKTGSPASAAIPVCAEPPEAGARAANADNIPPAHLPLIAAVVAATFGSGARIYSMSRVHPKQEREHHAWASEGRRDIFASHRVRTR